MFSVYIRRALIHLNNQSMKKTLLLVALVAFSTAAFSQASNYNVGDVVNDFTVTDTDGIEHNLYTITAQGKYVYLDFFFDICGPCQINQPAFNEFYDKYGCNTGDVYGLSINDGTDNNQEVEAYKDAFGGPWAHPPAASSEGNSAAVTTDFGVGAFPTFVLIGPGNILLEKDIWEGSVSVALFESTFPSGFEPPVAYCTPLGVGENELAVNFQLFPNPSDGSGITIELNQAIEDAVVTIYSVLGQMVYQETYSENNIQINQQLTSGSYLVQVRTEIGVATNQLIVK